jgi:nucleotide-binding universal stress UspA family protein
MASPREAAYRATSYAVDDGPLRFVIRIGARCAPLDELLRVRALEEWAYVTAWNPGGRLADRAANEAAQKRLEAELLATGRPLLRGASLGDSGEWPPEPSLLVLGIPRDEAVALARRYGQEAIVAGRRGAPAELVFCEPGATG